MLKRTTFTVENLDFLNSLINGFEELNYVEQKPNKKEIVEHMNKWRKTYNGKFINANVFWNMFFKELEKLL